MKSSAASPDVGGGEGWGGAGVPLALPAVMAGWLLSFTLSLDDVVVSSYVTGPAYEILPLKI